MDATYYVSSAWSFTSRTLYSFLTRRFFERADINSIYLKDCSCVFLDICVIAWLFRGVSWIFNRLRFRGKQSWWSFEYVSGEIADFQMWLLIPLCLSVRSRDTNRMLVEEFFLYSSIYPTRCNFTRFIYIWKLLYVFRVVPPPIIRSAQTTVSTASTICHTITATCCYRGGVATGLSVLWVVYTTHSTLKPVSSYVANTRCCRYSCLHSWWWVMVPPKTCRAVSR